MTEAEWLVSTDPVAIFHRIRASGRATDRKTRLFFVAQCRQSWSYLPDDESRHAVETAEQFADGLTGAVDLQSARDAIVPGTNRRWAEMAWLTAANPIVLSAARNIALSHDIFGNPFRSVTFSPDWRTPTVTTLAAQMYESRDFGAMPILADALQDAGCDSTDVLNHCRQPGVHVRGCWVVDWVLGKE